VVRKAEGNPKTRAKRVAPLATIKVSDNNFTKISTFTTLIPVPEKAFKPRAIRGGKIKIPTSRITTKSPRRDPNALKILKFDLFRFIA